MFGINHAHPPNFLGEADFFLFHQPSPWCQLSLTSAVAVCLHAGRLRDSEEVDIIIAPR